MGRRDAQVRGGSHLREPPDEQHVQTLVQDAVNSVKAFLDIAVQAMNEGMINVQIARIDDALSRLARL